MTQVGNWIGESTSSTGTGSLILDGAFEGYTEFSSYGDGDYWYTIVNGLNREAGICTIIGSTFVRTTIHSTLDSGVFNDVSPVPLALVDTSEIYVTFNKEAYDEIMTLIASGGIGVGTVTSVVGQAPIVITGTATVNPTVTISPATTSTAGSISGDDKLKLDGIAAGAQVNVPTDLTNVPDATTVALNSSTGADTTLPAATTSLAGVMTGADKTKLNAITGTNTGDQTTAVTAPILNSGTAAAPIIGSRVFGGAALSGHVPDPVTESQRYLMDDGSWQVGSGALTAEWLFDVSLDMTTAPAITYMRTNGTTLDNSTQVTVNKNTLDTGLNHGTANVLPGDILLVMDDSRNASSRYTVVSKVDNGTWVLLNVTHEAGSGNPLANDHMLVTWIPDALTTGGGHDIVEESGAALPTRSKLTFIGATVTAADNAANDSTDVTITGSLGGGGDVSFSGTAPADNVIARFNSTTGLLIQAGHSITIADGATGTLSGTNSGDNTANTTSNTYADGKVAQTLTDGVTTSAPSQNVVFDALALKEPTLPANTRADGYLLSSTMAGVKSWIPPATGGASPLTTKGDLYTYSTIDARLPTGLTGQALIVDPAQPTGLKWVTPTGSTGYSGPYGYSWSLATTGVMALGKVRINNANPALANTVVINERVFTAGNSNIGFFLKALKVGDWLNLAHETTPEVITYNYDVAGPAVFDGLETYTIPVTPFSSTGTFINNDPVDVIFRFGQATPITDHGALLGLEDNDHPQYSLVGAAPTAHTHPSTEVTDFTAAAKAAAVSNTLTNGVTDVAPSQDIVFDQLALKAPLTDTALFSTTTTAKGTVPGSSGAAATSYLNATGAWSVPAGGVGGSGTPFTMGTTVPSTTDDVVGSVFLDTSTGKFYVFTP